MKRICAFVTIAFIAGVGIGYFARIALQRRAHAADLAAIEKLHQEDVAVTLTQDPKGLVDVWAEDGVRITPGNPPTVGKAAIAAENEKGHAEHPEFKVLKYASLSRMAGRLRSAQLRPRTGCLQRTIRSMSTTKACVC